MLQKFTSDAIWNFLAQLALYLGQFLALWLLARALGPNEYGELTTALSIIAIFQIIAKFGIPDSTAKLLSEYRGKKSTEMPSIFREGLLLTIVSSTVTLAIYLILIGPISRLIESDVLYQILLFGGGFLFSRSFANFMQFVFQGLQKFDYKMHMGLINGVGYAIFAFLVIKMDLGAKGALVGLSLASIAATIFAVYKIDRSFWRDIDNLFTLDWKVLKYSLPLVLASLSSYMYRRLDAPIIRYFVNPAETGYYGIAQRIVDALLLPLGTLGAVVLQTVAYNWTGHGEDHAKLVKFFNLLNKYTIMMVLPIALLGITMGREAIELIWTSEYERAGVLFSVLSVDLVCRCLVTGSPFLIATGKAGYVSKIFGLSAVLTLVLNLFLIPFWGTMGAVVISLTVDGLVAITMFFLAIRLLDLQISPDFIQSLLRIGLAGGLMLIFTLLLPAFAVNTMIGRWVRLIIGSGTGILIYSAILILTHGITNKDLEFLSKMRTTSKTIR